MVIEFNKNFYNLEAIKSAFGAYRGLADFELKKNKKYFRILLKNINREISDVIKDEFQNYVLFLSLSKRK